MLATLIAAVALQDPTLVLNGVAVSIVSGVIIQKTDVDASPLMTKKPVFYVELANVSNKRITLLKENCSWGYEMLSFEWKDGAGKIHLVDRMPRPWYKNIPVPLPIAPGKSVFRGVNLNDGTWRGLPAGIGGNPQSLKLRTILRIDAAPYLENFWHGNLASQWHAAPRSSSEG